MVAGLPRAERAEVCFNDTMRWTGGARFLVAAAVALAAVGCGVDPASVGRGRADSWRRVDDPAFVAEASYEINGLAAPGDGYPAWTAVGSVRAAGAAPAPAVWSAADGSHWGRVDLETPNDRAAVLTAVARRQGVAVAVGRATTPGGDRDGRVWTSNDGNAWRAVALEPALAGGRGDQGMTSVAAGPLGFVAGGFDHRDGREIPAVWSSPDGSAWTRVGAGPGGPFEAGEVIRGVAVGDRGVVAVGTIQRSGDTDAMAWFSADGVTWRTAPLGAAGFTGPAEQAARAVTATADGFVSVGSDANADRRLAVAWKSADGISWQRQAPSPDMVAPGGGSTAGMPAVAVAGRGPLVALGGTGILRLWTSPDGRRWTREQTPDWSNYSEEALIAAEAGAVLVLPDQGALWFRPAGAAWVEVGGDKSVFPRRAHRSSIDSMVRLGGRYVGLGYDENGPAQWRSADGGAWVRSTPFATGSVAAMTVFGDALVAVGTRHVPGEDGNMAAVWISGDGGSTWDQAEPANPAFRIQGMTQMFGLAVAGPGLVAVGLGFDGNTIDAHVWFSSDGRTWRRAADPLAWSGRGDEILHTACALPGGGVVALGTVTISGEQDAWAWVSPDGMAWERAVGDGAAVLGGRGSQYPSGCVSTPTGVLVSGMTGGDGRGAGALWSTTDGRAWTAAARPSPFAGPANRTLFGIAIDGPRVVMTGRDGDGLLVFTSADNGATWEKRSASSFQAPGYQVADPLIAGGEVLVYGHDGPGAAVWVGPAP